jgi:hypothetical protein
VPLESTLSTLPRWLSGHLFANGDRDLLLTDMVRPTVAALLGDGRIDHFFFLRFDLGGPHIRLRLRTLAGREVSVGKTVEAAAASFFSRRPAPPDIPKDTIRQRNRAILAEDASERDDAVHPDQSILWPGWEPEADRYGGPALLPASLDFFAVSSARVLALLVEQAGLSRSRRLPGQLRLLAAQAWGMAGNREELESLLTWALPLPGHPLERFLTRGDQAFEKSRDGLVALLRSEVIGEASAEMLYSEAARRLRQEIATAPPDVRMRILKSQMHMTANRLGLSNPEEVHACRLLQRAAEALGDLQPHPAGPALPLGDLLPGAFTTWLHA